MSDLTEEEFRTERLGNLPEFQYATGHIDLTEEERVAAHARSEEYLREVYARADRWGTPNSYDAREHGLITTPKHQKTCGSCAAFTATAMHETCYIKAGVPLAGVDLSEQQLLGCGFRDGASGGCEGGNIDKYNTYFASKMGGVGARESQIPYTATQGGNPRLQCDKSKKWNAGAKVTGAYYDSWCSASKLQKLVYQHGAIGVGITIHDDFKSYKGDVYAPSPNAKPIKNGGHAVTVVGYHTDESQCYFWGWWCAGESYWIVKNSWGPQWGEQGYFRIKKGSNLMNIEQYCYVVDCSKTRSIEDVEDVDFEDNLPQAGKPTCDLSQRYPEFYPMNGEWSLGRENGNSTEEVAITCKDSVCSPLAEEVTDACMYICGASTC